MYKWESSFSEKTLVKKLKKNEITGDLNKNFIEKIFYLLNEGVSYTDFEGKFTGRINYVDGPLGGICIRSDHSHEREDNRFIIFKISYLDQYVLYFVIVDEKLVAYDFFNGHWANTIGRVVNKIKEI